LETTTLKQDLLHDVTSILPVLLDSEQVLQEAHFDTYANNPVTALAATTGRLKW